MQNNDLINNEYVKRIGQHSIKKFEIIEKYTESWAYKLLGYGRNSGNCNTLIFIDCMCNCGYYKNDDGEIIEGTPIRVARILSRMMREANFYNKQAFLYFNDLEEEKIELLKTALPKDTRNFHIETSVGDGNELIKNIGKKLRNGSKYSYLLVYDPFEAQIDWDAIEPFLNHWGEVIINHMVSDTRRAGKVVKKPQKKQKYEGTYKMPYELIALMDTNKEAYDKRIIEIIKSLSCRWSDKEYYTAVFSFYNAKNSEVYNLIHCTRKIIGFKLFKEVAWKTFGGHSSAKMPTKNEGQLMLDLTGDSAATTDSGLVVTTDKNCYNITDIAKYIQENFAGQKDVDAKEIYDFVDKHPVFPTEGFKKEIEKELKSLYGVKISTKPKRMTFLGGRG